ncbi:MAG: FAD/NAD(P)-binding protein [Candidatus Baltobacteraceae bacterium]
MKGEREVDDVAVIGGGLAGAAVAIACARFARHARLRLFSPEEPGRGAAYGSGSPIWLMNGPARAMSVVAGDSGHLVRALQCDPDALVSRERFGDYVGASLRFVTEERAQIRIERTAIVDLERGRNDFLLTDSRGRRTRAHTVVLALGNAKPADDFLPRELRESTRYFGDPWRTETSELPAGDMLCIGSGLTAMDRVAAFQYVQRRGTAFTLARHGYLPAREAPGVRACNYRDLNIDERSPLSLLRSVRAAMRDRITVGGDWREVAEALRQPSQRIWRGWTNAQRRHFLKRLAPLWGALRYRVPPATEDAVIALRRAGRYVPLRGEIVGATEESDGIRIDYCSRGERGLIRVASVVNCTGPNGDLAFNADPLVRSLLRRGLIRRDPLGLGLDATQYGEAIDAEGLIDERLLALGPLLRGILYESTAVPEIVEQARTIAQRVARDREEWVA